MKKIIYYIRGIISDWLLYRAMIVAPKDDQIRLAILIKEYMLSQKEGEGEK